MIRRRPLLAPMMTVPGLSRRPALDDRAAHARDLEEDRREASANAALRGVPVTA